MRIRDIIQGNDFIREIKQRPDIHLLELTHANRDRLPEAILGGFRPIITDFKLICSGPNILLNDLVLWSLSSHMKSLEQTYLSESDLQNFKMLIILQKYTWYVFRLLTIYDGDVRSTKK